ncbi:MAG: AbrB/MazE/SpoVT family DNA-binding domain-containing protein [Candidatus Dormibacteraceae bacterium]
MEATATITTKGQVTIPVTIREALRLKPGARLVFHLQNDALSIQPEGSRMEAEVKTFPDFLALAGSVPVPEEIKGMSYPAIRRQAMLDRLKRRISNVQ